MPPPPSAALIPVPMGLTMALEPGATLSAIAPVTAPMGLTTAPTTLPTDPPMSTSEARVGHVRDTVEVTEASGHRARERERLPHPVALRELQQPVVEIRLHGCRAHALHL